MWSTYLTTFSYKIFSQNCNFAKLSSSLLFAYVMGHKWCTIIWKLILKKFFSQISSGNLKFPQKSILAHLTTLYGQRLNIITFQWPGTIFDMWEPIPKHFRLYLKDMPTWYSNIKSRHDKRKSHQLFSKKPPKKVQNYVLHVREA